MVDSIIVLRRKSGYAFGPANAWINEVTGKLLCSHCNNVYESIEGIDVVVDEGNRRRRTDLDSIAGYCGYVGVFSTHFIDAVGSAVVKKTAWLSRLYDAAGFEHERYRTVVARKDNVVIRGSKDSHVTLCRACGRLLYWPVGESYVVRPELPRVPFFVSDDNVYCTQEFYEERIRDAKLCGIASHGLPIVDEPLDGLPGPTEELKAYLEKHGKFK